MKFWKQIGIKTAFISLALFLGMSVGVPALVDGYRDTVIQKGLEKAVFTIGVAGEVYAAVPDYIVDGTDDHVQAQLAIDALPATGGKVIFFGGNYDFGATITRAINNVTIEGSGKSTYFANDAATALFSAGAQTGWVFKDFRTDAGYITVSTGLDTIVSNVYNNTTLIGKTVRSGIIVAASDASATQKAQADYICDGTSDQTEINAALTTGEPVYLTGPGTHYNITDNISIPDHGYLDGMNAVITLKANNKVMIYNLLTLSGGEWLPNKGNITVKNLLLYGENRTGSVGFYGSGTCFGTFDKISMYEIDTGVQLYGNATVGAWHNTFTDLKIWVFQSYGIRFVGYSPGVSASADNSFYDLTLFGSDTQAVTAIDFATGNDSNQFTNTRISLMFTGSIGVDFNSASPATAQQIGQNHFVGGFIDCGVSGVIPVQAGYTEMDSWFQNVWIVGAAPVLPTAEGVYFTESNVGNGRFANDFNDPSFITPGGWFNLAFDTMDKIAKVTTGTGTIPVETIGRVDLSTGATSGGTAAIYTTGTGVTTIPNYTVAGRSANQIFEARVQWSGTDRTNSTVYVGVFGSTNSQPPVMTKPHSAFKIINGAIYATTGDATTETAVDTGVTYGAWEVHDLLIVVARPQSSAVPQVDFYVDGLLKAQITTHLGTDDNSFVGVYITSSTNSDRTILVSWLRGKI